MCVGRVSGELDSNIRARPRAGAREVPQLVIPNPVLPPRGEAYIVQLTPSIRGDTLEGVSVNLQLELESVVEHMRAG